MRSGDPDHRVQDQYKCTKCSNPCPPGFTVKEECGWWWWSSDVVECVAPTPPAAAVTTGAGYNTVGDCPCGFPSTCKASIAQDDAPACRDGDIDLGTRLSWCCSNVFGGCDQKYGQKKIRSCKNAGANAYTTFELWNPDGCKGYSTSRVTPNFEQCQWCGAPGMNTAPGHCWVPYWIDGDAKCHPLDAAKVGYWDATSFKKGGAGDVLNP